MLGMDFLLDPRILSPFLLLFDFLKYAKKKLNDLIDSKLMTFFD
jgi:hypothetical protein